MLYSKTKTINFKINKYVLIIHKNIFKSKIIFSDITSTLSTRSFNDNF